MRNTRMVRFIVFGAVCVAFVSSVHASIVYVSATSGSDGNNGSSWALAKQTIQAGMDAAVSNDTVLVTNGTYNTGSRLSPGQMLCRARVVIDKAVRVISVNGPSNTFIVGQGPRDENAIRCVWMTNNAYLTGFTLINGFTVAAVGGVDENGGGVFAVGESVEVSNCIITTCQAYDGGGASGGTLKNCTLAGNLANSGGGARDSTLSNCMLTGNSASSGGGTYNGALYNCTLSSNSANFGGGAYQGTLNNCTLTGNSAGSYDVGDGGGAHQSTLNNCTLTSNRSFYGGGAYQSTLNNCTLSGNSGFYGGGAYQSTLNNCTLSGNSTWIYNGNSGSGGGADGGTLNNCTLYGNSRGGIYGGTARNTISYGNTGYDMTNVSSAFCYTNDPLFVNAVAGNLRLQPNSPCINTGYNPFAPTNVTPYDLDGNPRIAQLTVDKGAYEFQGVDFFELFASAGTHGSIIPSGIIRTNQGTNVSFIMQPDAYYHVQNVLTNGSSVGAVTNFTWYNISAPGTITVSFAATLAAHGTPHWWLAQFGWTQNFDTVESLDQDGDSLFTWQEYPPNTCPTNANTDGDQYNDGVEVNAGADPLHNDSQNYAAMLNHPATFNCYTSNSVQDLSYGEVMMSVVTNSMRVLLTMQSTEELGGGWSNVGSLVEWQYPVNSNKYFFRFLGGPED